MDKKEIDALLRDTENRIRLIFWKQLQAQTLDRREIESHLGEAIIQTIGKLDWRSSESLNDTQKEN